MTKHIDPVTLADTAFGTAMTERFGTLQDLVKRCEDPKWHVSRNFLQRAGIIVNAYLFCEEDCTRRETDRDLYEFANGTGGGWLEFITECRDQGAWEAGPDEE